MGQDAEAELADIAVVDVREGGPVRHTREGRERMRVLRHGFRRDPWFLLSLPLMPLLDRLARRWFRRSESPYVGEIEQIAATADFSGIWFLNASYEFSCTALAREEAGAPWLARTFDWPFPGLGRHVEVARMRGAAGEFLAVTWPGYVGIQTAIAPGRFAAAINHAPLRRRTRGMLLRGFDLAAEIIRTWLYIPHIPPDHLLRRTFETCRSYAEAKAQLERVPVSRPVIVSLVGCAPGERCVIERTEDGHRTRTEATTAANDWRHGDPRWEARVGGDVSWTASYAQAAAGSRRRAELAAEWKGSFGNDSFGWVAPPILNPYTRVATEMCPARGVLRIVGYEVPRGAKLPAPATRRLEMAES